MIRSRLLAGAVAAAAVYAGAAHAGDDLFSRLEVQAQSGDSLAQYMLGKTYLNGADFAGTPPRHVVPDLEQAELWLGRAADQGFLEAEVVLAEAYDKGPFPRDVRKAIKWYARVAGDAGDSDADKVDANSHLCALVMEKPVRDPDTAEAYCAYSAAHGKPEGYFEIAKAFETGDGANPLKALGIYRELGDMYGYQPALEKLAVTYDKGGALAGRSEEEALRWYMRLSEAAPETYLIEVAHRLEKGAGAPIQPVDAGRYYLAAAKAGNAEAGVWLIKHPAVTAAWVDLNIAKHAKDGISFAETDAGGRKTSDFYPERAQANEIEGSVTIDCRVSPDGALDRCLPKAETPEGEGFAKATVKVARGFISIRPEWVKTLAGKLVRVTYKWQLAD
jgi:TPR repeat protein